MALKQSHCNGELFQKLRYAVGSESETFIEWSGTVTAYIPGERPKHLFNCIGMNVSRAIRYTSADKDTLQTTSRELTYYLDPVTGEPLSQWENPWTKEQLPVIHIANDPVQMEFPWSMSMPLRTNPWSNSTFLSIEVPLFYPNPLFTPEGKYKDYDNEKMYQAGEMFTFRWPTTDADKPVIDAVDIQWTRICRFAPFMKMGASQGYLVYNCTGYKLPLGSTYKQLSPLLVHAMETKMNTYCHAPTAYDVSAKTVSSWNYFKDNFDRYEKDKQAEWPIPSHAE
ncbi:hypothetical protein BDF14DRAFT_1780431 [Spinellus fusiger]|nr:hypothetical protein BDF14DRAFT_1780431 [Spinellus fusiger]